MRISNPIFFNYEGKNSKCRKKWSQIRVSLLILVEFWSFLLKWVSFCSASVLHACLHTSAHNYSSPSSFSLYFVCFVNSKKTVVLFFTLWVATKVWRLCGCEKCVSSLSGSHLQEIKIFGLVFISNTIISFLRMKCHSPV